MNILLFSWRGPNHPNAGGAEISSHEHAKGWVREGHKVTLFTSFFSGAKREEVIDGIAIKRYGRQMFGVQWEAFVWYLFKAHEKFDLVIDQFHGIPFFTPIYIRAKKLAFIHEVAKEVWSLNSWPKPYNLLPTIIGTILEPLIFKFFYRNTPFMTVSDSTKQDLILWGIQSQKIAVIHNGVIVPRKLQLFQKEKEPTLIFLGAISRDKGIEESLKAFARLYSQNKKYKLWVVGKAEGNYLERLKILSNRLGIKKGVTFYGFVNETKKFKLLAKAHILINTSVREGWGLVVIEAASVGTPTLAFDAPGLRDSIKDKVTGLLCKRRDTDELANLIKETIEDKTLFNDLSKNAYAWSEKFNWDKSVALSLQLIKRIAG